MVKIYSEEMIVWVMVNLMLVEIIIMELVIICNNWLINENYDEFG